MSAAALALGATGIRPCHAQEGAKVRRAWVLSDIHCGYAEGGKDGAAWLENACTDIRDSGIAMDHAVALGDLTHDGTEAEILAYLKARDTAGINRWHEIAGNHEYDKQGTAGAFTRMIRSTDPYSFLDGNVAWIMLSDEMKGVEGNLREESCQWLEKTLAGYRDKIVIVCSHQLVKGTVSASDQHARHLHPADRIADIIAKSKIDLWLCGHEHHTPYTPGHIVRKGQTTFINVASLSHAYKTGKSQSVILEFEEGTNRIIARRREHDIRGDLPEFETIIPLRMPILPAAS